MPSLRPLGPTTSGLGATPLSTYLLVGVVRSRGGRQSEKLSISALLEPNDVGKDKVTTQPTPLKIIQASPSFLLTTSIIAGAR